MKNKILKLCINSKNGMIMRENVFRKNYINEYNEILKMQFPNDFTFKQKLYHWIHNDYNLTLGICPVCKKRCTFTSISNGYYHHCSVTCSNLDKDVLDKKKQICFKKYGSKTYNNRKQAIQTCLKRYNKANPGMVEEIKEKIKQTKNKNHGNPYFTNRDKYFKTIKEKYGVDNISQIDFVKEKIKKNNIEKYGVICTLQNEKVKEKTKKTCIEKFGVDNYSKSNDRAQKESERFKKTHDLYVKKGLKQVNGISKLELDFYSYLVKQFGKDNVLTQYMSELYPYKCDFYIKSLELYIELNAHWTHGKHPFDLNNSDDVELLECWRNKHSRYYDIAVNVWGYKDVEKRNCAKENHLKFIELFDSKLNDCIEHLNFYLNYKYQKQSHENT